jgi:hypothetical protein
MGGSMKATWLQQWLMFSEICGGSTKMLSLTENNYSFIKELRRSCF